MWLGDCYPAHFYDHLNSEVRDVFYELTENTQHDLNIIQKKLEEFDIVSHSIMVVNRDEFDNRQTRKLKYAS